MNTALLAQAARPNAGHRHWNEGLASLKRRDYRAAARAFGRATDAAPADTLYWVNLANAQRHAGELVKAESAARRGLLLEPENPILLRLLADCLSQMHRYAEAVETLSALEASGVEDADALMQHGSMLQSLQRHGEAVDMLLRALSLKPDMTRAHALLADAFRDLGLKREAVECMKTVLALEPDNLEALSHLSFERRHLCDWQGFDADVARIEDSLVMAPAGLGRIAAAFGLLSLPLAPALQLAAASSESLALTSQVVALPPVLPAQRAGQRPRLGFVSYDFREHPVSQLLVELIETLDREHFEVVLYSSGPDDRSPLRGRVAAAADCFVDIRGLSDQQAAERVRADGIDVLFDLMGHTRGHRMAVFARQPAPLQVAYLGYPGSTGARFMDYFIGDGLATPPELASQFSEKLALMPLTFQPNGRWRPLPQPMTRAEVGLPEDAFVMCAFNHTYKILPEAFDTWCAVMREVPHAVLWLKETNLQLRENVLHEAAQRGVEAERIVFARLVSYEQHFSRLALADVFVDTWPYNAHTTAADALWAGVPVVTVYGNAFASRVAASVLSAAGLGELAFATVDEYRCAITALAQDRGLLAGYRQHLSEQRLQLPLFDRETYVRDFEALVSRMVQRWRDGLPAAHLLPESA